ncbi:MAG: restriction endonuclease subunit S [Alphaproteobacteria bacterium]
MDLLEKHFDTAFDAPDGIKKLRELILALAMQGKLVPQDENDKPAKELLKEIEAEKQKLIKEGKIKKPKPLPEIKPDEIPYQIPKNWQWVRLRDVAKYIQRGKSPVYSEIEQIPIISQKSIQWSGFDKNVVRFIDPKSLDKYQDERFIKTGDLLWNSTGTGTIGRINIYNDELNEFKYVVADSHVTIVRPINISNYFLLMFLMSPVIQSNIEKNASGTTNQIELNTSTIVNQPIPLPPLEEQRRIVAKVDELMARCDELEKQKQALEEKRLNVHAYAIYHLLNKEGDFKKSWHFISKNFDELYSVNENVAELRKAILQLAMQGKLVPQDENDKPAKELLKEIEAEKQKLIKEGKIKKPKPLPEIKPDEIPYQIPKNWQWVRLGEISNINGGFAFKSNLYTNKGVRVIRISDFDETGFKDDKIVRYEYNKSLSQYLIEKNNIIIAMTGGTVGKSYHVKNVSEILVSNQRVATIKVYQTIKSFFVNIAILSPAIQAIIKKSKNSTNDNISMDLINNFLIPLPPLEEQKRIVAKVDELMARCDELEKQINLSTNQKSTLLNTIMAKI